MINLPPPVPPCTAPEPSLVTPKREFLVLWLMASSSPQFFVKNANGHWTLFDNCSQTTVYDPDQPIGPGNQPPFTTLDWTAVVAPFIDSYPNSIQYGSDFTQLQNAFTTAANGALPADPNGDPAYPDHTICPTLAELLALLS
jgi:hypothetical protein